VSDSYMNALRGDVPTLDPVDAAYKRILSEVEGSYLRECFLELSVENENQQTMIVRPCTAGVKRMVEVHVHDACFGDGGDGLYPDASQLRQMATYLLAAARWLEEGTDD